MCSSAQVRALSAVVLMVRALRAAPAGWPSSLSDPRRLELLIFDGDDLTLAERVHGR